MAKILFLTRLYEPHIGGVEKHVGEISKKLVEKGHRVKIITTKDKSNLLSSEIVNGVEIRRLRRPQVKFLGLIVTWFKLLSLIKTIKSADILHCHDVFIWYLPFRFIFPNKKVYTTFHGWEGEYPIPVKNIYLKKLAANLSIKNICVGKYIEKYYGIKADLITHGATDIPDGKIKKTSKSIVYVGRLEANNSLRAILKAFEKLDGYTIEFCGDGSYADECRKVGKVHGFVDPKKYLKKAKYAFVGGYLSTLEAFSYKCVVFAAYDNPLRKDYFYLTPFFKWVKISEDPRQIVKGIKILDEDDKLFKRNVSEALDWAKEQTWEKLTNKYLNLWEIKN